MPLPFACECLEDPSKGEWHRTVVAYSLRPQWAPDVELREKKEKGIK